MSLILPENSSAPQPEEGTPAPRTRLSWIDVVLLVVVLGALVVLLRSGMGLPEALAIVGAGGILSAELRRRISQS